MAFRPFYQSIFLETNYAGLKYILHNADKPYRVDYLYKIANLCMKYKVCCSHTYMAIVSNVMKPVSL